ncbi:MAG: TRAP transporter small permease [Synergistaceae bacterium]|jgi:TRAP-type C4-dicarboxylate transport system permease small subunit|nr:TRAP transporter small permease [Synergistaceae bacterium]
MTPVDFRRSFLGRLSDGVNSVCEVGLFATLALMTGVTILQIVCRIGFRALTWSEEATCFLLVFASFLGTTVAFKRGSNIAVNFMLNVLPAPLKKIVTIAIELTGIVFFGVTGWYGAVLCIEERMQMASSMPISMAWMYLVFPLTGAVAILHLVVHIENLFRYGAVSAEGEAPEREAPEGGSA